MNLKSVVIFSFLGLFIHVHAYAIELSDSNLEMLKNQARVSVENLEMSVNQYDQGFADALSEFDSIPITDAQIEKFLPYWHLRALHSSEGVSDYVSGKLSAYKLVQILLVRSSNQVNNASKVQPSNILRNLKSLGEDINLLIDKYLSNYKKKHNDVIIDIQEKIKIQIGRDIRALEDPTYISAPYGLNSFSKLNIISDFEEALKEVTDLSISAKALSDKYKYLYFENSYGDEFRLVTRLKTLPDIFRDFCIKYVDSYALKGVKVNDASIKKVNDLIENENSNIDKSNLTKDEKKNKLILEKQIFNQLLEEVK